MLNLAIKESLKTQCAELHTQYEESGVNWLEMLRGEEKILPKFCLHLLNQYTQDNNVQIWARGPAKPPCRFFNIYADMYKYQVLSINERTKAPKPDTKTPKN